MKENLLKLDWKELNQILFTSASIGNIETVSVLLDNDFKDFYLNHKIAFHFSIENNHQQITELILNHFKGTSKYIEYQIEGFKWSANKGNPIALKFFMQHLDVTNNMKQLRTIIIDLIKERKNESIAVIFSKDLDFIDIHLSNDIFFRIAMQHNPEIVNLFLFELDILKTEKISFYIEKYNLPNITKLFQYRELNKRLPNKNLKEKPKKI